jgi:transcriptional regulator with XRE-family HTH domain
MVEPTRLREVNEAEQDGLFTPAVGERLRLARQARGMSLEDVAAKTRVPTRHLQHIEAGNWDALPAVTYSIGFARAYANAVGLEGSRIAAELRAQLGSDQNYSSAPAYYEATDPARVPPRSLAILMAVAAVLLAIAFVVWRSGAVDDSDIDQQQVAGTQSAPAPVTSPAPVAAPAGQPLAGPPAAAGAGPVVLTAITDVWLRVYEADGGPRLFENTLKAGERFEVPSTARRPQILTGRPDAVRVTVGTTQIPPLGTPDRTISDVSLAPADLLARSAPAAPQLMAPAAR